MATIKILPKNIFKVSNFNNLKNNKIKGISANIGDVSSTKNDLGNYEINRNNDFLYNQPFIGNWYQTSRVAQTNPYVKIKVFEALRFRALVTLGKNAFDVESEQDSYVDYARLYATATYNTSGSDTITNEDVLKSQYGVYGITINVPTPTSLGTIKWSGSGNITGTVSEKDIETLKANNRTYVKDTITYAIEEGTATKTSFSFEFVVTSMIIMECDFSYIVFEVEGNPDDILPPSNDPYQWQFYSGDCFAKGYEEGKNLGLGDYSADSVNMSTSEISFTTYNYVTSSTATNIGQEPFLKFDDNLFFRNDILYNSSNTAYNQLKNKIVNDWNNGKETVTLKCNIGEYYDTSGNLALSTKNNSLPMTFSIGDIVVPYVINGQGQQVPLSKTTLGYAKTFKVIDKRLYTDGCCWQEIDLQEATSY